MKIEFSQQIFDTSSNKKFRQNPSSGSRVVPCGQTDRRRTNMKVIVAFRNFANAPNNELPQTINWYTARRQYLIFLSNSESPEPPPFSTILRVKKAVMKPPRDGTGHRANHDDRLNLLTSVTLGHSVREGSEKPRGSERLSARMTSSYEPFAGAARLWTTNAPMLVRSESRGRED